MTEEISSGLRCQMRQKLASQDTGERSDFGQDDVPPSTETGKKKVKADGNTGIWEMGQKTEEFPPKGLYLPHNTILTIIITVVVITDVPGT